MRIGHLAVELLSILLGVAFLLSALSHWESPYWFLQTIFEYDLLPATFAPTIATVLLFSNVIAGCCLVLRFWRGPGIALGTILLMTYFLAQTQAFFRGLRIGCGCFSPTSEVIGVQTLITTGAMLAAAVTLAILEFQRQPANEMIEQ